MFFLQKCDILEIEFVQGGQYYDEMEQTPGIFAPLAMLLSLFPATAVNAATPLEEDPSEYLTELPE